MRHTADTQLKLARRLWGDQALVVERTPASHSGEGAGQFLVGESRRGVFIIRGVGSSWEAAFEDAFRTYPELRSLLASSRTSSRA